MYLADRQNRRMEQDYPMKWTILLASVWVLALPLASQASSDGLCGFSDDECGVSALPYLQPGNDTRVNLLLLLASLKDLTLPVPQPAPVESRSMVNPFTAYRVMGLSALDSDHPGEAGSTSEEDEDAALAVDGNADRRAVTPPEIYRLASQLNLPTDILEPLRQPQSQREGRQISNDTDSVSLFLQQLIDDSALSAPQRTTLAQTRLVMMSGVYDHEQLSQLLSSLPNDGPAADFKHYLLNAAAFYHGDFDRASQGFEALKASSQPWVAETASYMLIRLAINQSVVNALDEYNMFDMAKADRVTAALALTRINDYLKQYPKGAYASSAAGLVRRVNWILGDAAALDLNFQQAFNAIDNVNQLQILADEVDNKLLENPAFLVGNATLMLVQDLKRLRSDKGWNAFGPLSGQDVADQLSLFDQVGRQDYSAYLQLARQFYIDKDYPAVLSAVTAYKGKDLSNIIDFSQQVLRGQAMEKQQAFSDAEQHWRHLLTLKTSYTQQQYLQYALALNLAYSGHPEKIFAKDSPVTNLRFRSSVLKFSANARVLRQQSQSGPSTEERTIALHTLLTKELTHGLFSDFLQDAELRASIPAQSKTDDDNNSNDDALTVFNWDGSTTESGYQCPALEATVQTLQTNPNDARAMNCLGEFFLRTDNDVYQDWDELYTLSALASAPTTFEGKTWSRLDGYMAVINDAKAPAEDRSYALYRAINCYAPSGNNDCGTQQISKAQRKAWFRQLKSDYKGSQWAKQLNYYW